MKTPSNDPVTLKKVILEQNRKIAELEAKNEEMEDLLRHIASYLGAGGFNAPVVVSKDFEAKIMWGIHELEKKIVSLGDDLAAIRDEKKRQIEYNLAMKRGISVIEIDKNLVPG